MHSVKVFGFWDIKCLLLLMQIQLRTLNYIFKGTIIFCYSSLVCANQSKLHLSCCNGQFVSVLSGFNRVTCYTVFSNISHVRLRACYNYCNSFLNCVVRTRISSIPFICNPHLYCTNLSMNINQNNREISTTEHCINWY